MRKSILAAIAAISLAGGAGGAVMAIAQPAPQLAPQLAPAGPPAPGGPGPMGWMQERMGWMHHHGREEMERRMPFAPGTFALFARKDDRQLTPSDVQTIAQALLVWHGNHTWKVTDIAPGQDGSVRFTYAAPDGTVIAQFAVDTKTGRISRVG